GPALEDDDGPGDAHDPARHARRRRRGGPPLHHPDGGRRRAAPAVHRGERAVREESGRLTRTNTFTSTRTGSGMSTGHVRVLVRGVGGTPRDVEPRRSGAAAGRASDAPAAAPSCVRRTV